MRLETEFSPKLGSIRYSWRIKMVKLAAIQLSCNVGDVDANLEKARNLIRDATSAGAEFICLPELFSTGAAGDKMRDLAEPIPGPTTAELAQIARDNSVYIVAGVAEKEPSTEKLYNASVLLSLEGELLTRYRKVFLYLDEKESFTPGDDSCVCDVSFGKIALTICYDYVFPEYIRHLVLQGAELLVHSTAWLTTDECERWHYNRGAYRAMGMTRALENGVYFISANHWGNYDVAGHLRGVGQSSIISPWGEILAEIHEGEGIAIADVDFEAPTKWRQEIAPYLADFSNGKKRLSFI
jgi:predicted amidohydrolase